MYMPINGPHSGCCSLGVFASYPQRSRVYAVRLSCELPYAVGVGKNGAHSITCRQKSKGRPDHAFFKRLPQVGLEPTNLR